MSYSEYLNLTLHEWYWRVIGYGRRRTEQMRDLRKVLTLIYNVNCKEGKQLKEWQFMPLPGDEPYRKAAELDREIKERVRKSIEAEQNVNKS